DTCFARLGGGASSGGLPSDVRGTIRLAVVFIRDAARDPGHVPAAARPDGEGSRCGRRAPDRPGVCPQAPRRHRRAAPARIYPGFVMRRKRRPPMVKRTRSFMKENDKPATIAPTHTHGEQGGAIAGEIVGGVVGAAAGLPGVVAGMVLGGAA